MHASVLELEAGADRQRTGRFGGEDLAGAGSSCDAGDFMYRNATGAVRGELNFANMNADPHRHLLRLRSVLDCCGTLQRTGRTIEQRENAVARRIDLPPPEPTQQHAYRLQMVR